METTQQVTIKDYTDTPRKFWGVFENGEPRGRVRLINDRYVAFTNRRETGKASVGSFDTLNEAAEAVVGTQR